MKVAFLGLSITSSWGNGHATNYRALAQELSRRDHDVVFCERDVPWYAAHRDLARPPFCRLVLYRSFDELRQQAEAEIASADLVVVGSYVPQGAAIADWALETAAGLTAFYDIDTPMTLGGLQSGDCDYLVAELVPRFDVYLSFTGGPALSRLERELGARRAIAFYCLVDERAYVPVVTEVRWDLGYLGTYSPDRQAKVQSLLIAPARRAPALRFVVAGPQYPVSIDWPSNVERIEHVAPPGHPAFYCGQRFALSITRAEMVRAGWSPSVRLFEAAACGVPIISDRWPGIDQLFVAGEEILLADGTDELLDLLFTVAADQRQAIADRARRRVLDEHTAAARVDQLEELLSTRLADEVRA